MSTVSDNNTRIAKNSIYMSIRMVLVLSISLYTSRIILEILGVEDYGIYNVVAGFVTMFGFLNISLSNGIQRYFNYELGKHGIEGANKVYNMAILIQIILALLVILPTEILGTWYLHNKMIIPSARMVASEWIFQLSLLAFFFNILQVPFIAAVMAHERMDFYAFMSIINALMTLGCSFVIPHYSGDHLIFYGVFITFIAFLSLLLFILYSKKNFKEIHISFKFHKQLFKEMLSFSGWNIFGTLGHMFKDQGINLILNFFFGPIVNAARAVATQVNSGLQSFVSNITVPVRPQVIQSYSKGDIYRSLSLSFTISKLSCFVLLFVALPILLEIQYVLRVWLGMNIPKYSSQFVIIIVANSFVNNLNTAISGIVHATGRMKAYQLSGGTISILSVFLAFLFLQIYDIPSIAFLVVLVCDIIRQVVALEVLDSIVCEFSLKDYFNKVVVPLLAVLFVSIIFPCVAHLLLQSGFLRFCIVSILSILSVSISVYLFGLSQEEKNLVNKLADNIKSKFLIVIKQRKF